MKESVFTVEYGGERMDVYLSSATGKTRSQIKALNDSGSILCNGSADKCGRILKSGDVIILREEAKEVLFEAEDIPVDVIYEDGDVAVINKRQGMSVHPGAGNKSGTLANALLHRFRTLSSCGGETRPGIVHRLDKDTSGVLIVAKNDAAHLALSKQFAAHSVQKIYIALLEGNLKEDSGQVRGCIGRSPRDRKKMAVLPTGKEAVTFYKVLERYEKNCLAEFDIKTGRTHQIRVHAQYLGHPVVGDKVYGYAHQRFDLEGQLLHAARVTFRHPASGEEMTFSAPLPDYFERVLAKLREEQCL